MVTLSSDQGKLMHAISSVPFEGDSVNLKSAVQVAQVPFNWSVLILLIMFHQLVLKHRQNGNQHQRIVVFAGSPLGLLKDDCLSLHKTMRKNNIAVDVVSFGAVAENDTALEALLYGEETENAAAIQDGEDGSRLVRVFQGQGSIVETIAASPVVRGVASTDGGDANGAGFEFGVDPEMDPELAMALKLSMEEEMARQAAQSKQQPEEAGEPAIQMEVDEEDEDALLQQAIAMSMQDQQKPQ
jgi:26S proteasome regulatory subunit N10